jgi:hypothetical protein
MGSGPRVNLDPKPPDYANLTNMITMDLPAVKESQAKFENYPDSWDKFFRHKAPTPQSINLLLKVQASRGMFDEARKTFAEGKVSDHIGFDIII